MKTMKSQLSEDWGELTDWHAGITYLYLIIPLPSSYQLGRREDRYWQTETVPLCSTTEFNFPYRRQNACTYSLANWHTLPLLYQLGKREAGRYWNTILTYFYSASGVHISLRWEDRHLIIGRLANPYLDSTSLVQFLGEDRTPSIYQGRQVDLKTGTIYLYSVGRVSFP